MRLSLLLPFVLAAVAQGGEKDKLWTAVPHTPDHVFTPGIEGPNCDKHGNVYAVNFAKQQTIGKTTPAGKSEVFVTLPGKSTGNGIVFDGQGKMYVADYVGHNVLTIDLKTRKIEVFAHNPKMNQPNDLAIAPDGTLYASDPNWKEETGQLWRIDRSGKTHLLAAGMGTTNGIEVSPDGKTLYVNESRQRNVWAFDIQKDGGIANKRLLKKFPDHGFDGMRADIDGNLYITRHGKGTVVVLSPKGEILREIDVLGSKPSNLCFGGPDGKTVYVTEVDKGRLVRFRTDRPGLAWVRWQTVDAECCAEDPPKAAPEPKAVLEDGFRSMFDGKTLQGWVNVNGAPGTFFVQDGMIITTGRPTGFLRTDKQYENFILEFEWMHMKKDGPANSGLFVWGDPIPAKGSGYTRGIEVQVLCALEKKGFYTSHGDIFSIWGATCEPDRPHPNGWARCLPSEERCKPAGFWNHYRVEAKDGRITLAVNGKVVSGVSKCSPRKGYLALESEGSECRFKNLKIKELPGSDPKPAEVADVAQGHQNLYTGLNLDGWKVEGMGGAFLPRDWILAYEPKGGKGARLVSDRKFGDMELILDFRVPGKKVDQPSFLVGRGVDYWRVEPSKPGAWSRLKAVVRGDTYTLAVDDRVVLENGRLKGQGPAPIVLEGFGQPVQFGNLFVREMK